MKQIKLFFAAVSLLVIVGAAVAFKVAKFGAPTLNYCNTNVIPNVCALTDRYTTVPNGPPVIPPYALYTGRVGQICGSPACPLLPRTTPVYASF